MKGLAIALAGLLIAACTVPRTDSPGEAYRAQGTRQLTQPKKYGLAVNYTGPQAEIVDTVVLPGSGSALYMFYVRSIDGEVVENAETQSKAASYGSPVFLPQWTRRQVPVRVLRLELVGTYAVPDPVKEIWARMTGNFFSVIGTIEFTPEDGRVYVVRGVLARDGSSVWIETQDTQELASERVLAKP